MNRQQEQELELDSLTASVEALYAKSRELNHTLYLAEKYTNDKGDVSESDRRILDELLTQLKNVDSEKDEAYNKIDSIEAGLVEASASDDQYDIHFSHNDVCGTFNDEGYYSYLTFLNFLTVAETLREGADSVERQGVVFTQEHLPVINKFLSELSTVNRTQHPRLPLFNRDSWEKQLDQLEGEVETARAAGLEAYQALTAARGKLHVREAAESYGLTVEENDSVFAVTAGTIEQLKSEFEQLQTVRDETVARADAARRTMIDSYLEPATNERGDS